jgi:hypothetical protein
MFALVPRGPTWGRSTTSYYGRARRAPKPGAVPWLAAALGLTAALGCGQESGACHTIDCADRAEASVGGAGGATPRTSTRPSLNLQASEEQPAAALEDQQVCDAQAFEAQASPVNLLILVDRSVSMNEPAEAGVSNSPTRWQAVTAAIRSFVNSETAAGAQVGLQFFGLKNGADDCGSEKYRKPAVAIGPLPSVRANLLTAIDGTQPGSLTPTEPALIGALDYAQSVAKLAQNANRTTAVVLASDGVPSECGPKDASGVSRASVATVVDVVKRYATPPSGVPAVKTYVIGTEELGNNAQLLAEAGGGQAFLIGDHDVEATFREAMLSIVTRPLDCTLPVPERAPSGERINYERIRVRFSVAGSERTVEFPRASDASGCAGSDGWFYDDPQQPKRIELCEQTCAGLGAGRLLLEFGCEPKQLVF